MAKTNISDLLSKLSLDSEEEDHLTFYLAILCRKKVPYLISKRALFIQEIKGNGWIYLELRKIKEKFVWGCSICENLKTFQSIKDGKTVFENYCIHSQVAFMLIDEEEMSSKYHQEKERIEVLTEKPYFAVAHTGKVPAIILLRKCGKQ